MGGVDGLAAAMLCAFVFVSPIGRTGAAAAFGDPVALAAGVGVGVSSSVIPYVFDQLAMARLPRATYALFVALLPATATVIGVMVPPSAAIGSRPRRHRAGDVRCRAPPARPQPAETMKTNNDELIRAANVVVDRLGLANGEEFLVVWNPELAAIANAVAEAACARTPRIRSHEFAPGSRDGEEPPETVADAMRSASATAILTRYSLSHTRARMAATQAGGRIASMPGITLDLFVRAIPIDYGELQQAGRALARKLTGAKVCRVTSPAGTEIDLMLAGRSATCDDGDLRRPAAFGNLPAGEAYIAPVEDDANGTIVFDGSLAGFGILDEPVLVEVRHGRAITIGGGKAADWLAETLDHGGESGRILAELGIGTNPGATISGQILEDEKAHGTAHFAFGTNTSFGGRNQADVHIDGLVRNALVELDGCPVGVGEFEAVRCDDSRMAR